jgi:glutamyl/glutaminyl-tRNA synthetase
LQFYLIAQLIKCMSPSPGHFNKTRIAPTPSGFLHLGNVMSFAVTARLARENGAKVLLRIDDLDRARADKKYIQDIFDTLDFMAIPWDEGPRNIKDFEENYSQLHRLHLYREALNKLCNDGRVFACNCSRRQLELQETCRCIEQQIPLDTPNVNWRLLTGDTMLTVKNYRGDDIQAVLPAVMHNFVVRKRDGLPAYQLASVIDDLYYGIDLIVRGEDLWPSTLAQQELGLAQGNNFGGITFHHHPLLMGPDGAKLSKSAGDTSIKYLRESGKKPADIYRMTGENSPF